MCFNFLSIGVCFIILQQIKRELLDSQQKVSSLQDLSAQLLVNTKLQTQTSEQIPAKCECLEAREKVHVIWNRLRLLLREVGSDLEGLERRLEAMDTQQVRQNRKQREKNTVLSRYKCYSGLFLFIFRTAYHCLLVNQKSLHQLLLRPSKAANDW